MLMTGSNSIRDVVLFPLLRKRTDEEEAAEEAVESSPEV
jgi:aspartyl-tRNA synthetase